MLNQYFSLINYLGEKGIFEMDHAISSKILINTQYTFAIVIEKFHFSFNKHIVIIVRKKMVNCDVKLIVFLQLSRTINS